MKDGEELPTPTPEDLERLVFGDLLDSKADETEELLIKEASLKLNNFLDLNFENTDIYDAYNNGLEDVFNSLYFVFDYLVRAGKLKKYDIMTPEGYVAENFVCLLKNVIEIDKVKTLATGQLYISKPKNETGKLTIQDTIRCGQETLDRTVHVMSLEKFEALKSDQNVMQQMTTSLFIRAHDNKSIEIEDSDIFNSNNIDNYLKTLQDVILLILALLDETTQVKMVYKITI